MKKYFAVWEAYSNDWRLIEKGYHFFQAESLNDLMDIMEGFCEESASARGISSKFFTISSCQPL